MPPVGKVRQPGFLWSWKMETQTPWEQFLSLGAGLMWVESPVFPPALGRSHTMRWAPELPIQRSPKPPCVPCTGTTLCLHPLRHLKGPHRTAIIISHWQRAIAIHFIKWSTRTTGKDLWFPESLALVSWSESLTIKSLDGNLDQFAVQLLQWGSWWPWMRCQFRKIVNRTINLMVLLKNAVWLRL